ncbi:hypothetical protein F5148DRAFT_723973 [Russula earlei]|uniref:Uncharacterized protein n=1 Tax=Russula earlei TaxID=71964 RepID=A0ACC0UF02_9AGAM|nr:hypothetical protein F5148DRAFT_723973 [Russula earlei]
MSADIALDDLSGKLRTSSSIPPDVSGSIPCPASPEESREGATPSWTWATSAILFAWSCALIFFPRVLLFAIGQSQQQLTPFESFLALHFGLLLAFSAAGLITNVPSSSPASLLPERAEDGRKGQPSRHPLIVPMTSFSLIGAFLSYNTAGAGSLPKIYSACAGLIGIWGLWAIVFADPAPISRKTGADKHTSALIFGNKSSASEQKKRWRRE